MYLHQYENSTEYLNNLIDKDRLDRLDSIFIDNKIKEHQGAIKELQDLKKVKPVNEDKIHELLGYHAPAFKQNAMTRTESQRYHFIEKMILPDLKKLGSKNKVEEIDKILLNWPD